MYTDPRELLEAMRVASIGKRLGEAGENAIALMGWLANGLLPVGMERTMVLTECQHAVKELVEYYFKG